MKTQNEHNSMMLTDLFLVIIFISAILGLAVTQAGAAETAGQKLDQAVEKTDKKLEATKQSLGESAVKTGEYMDDSVITSTIKAEILSDPMLKVSQINVTTTKGVVVLSGGVDSKQSIDRVLQIVSSNKNVKSVENKLVVKPSR